MNYHSMVERNREAGRQMAEMAVQVIREHGAKRRKG